MGGRSLLFMVSYSSNITPAPRRDFVPSSTITRAQGAREVQARVPARLAREARYG